MTNRNKRIEGFAVGNDVDVVRVITGVPSGQTLVKAWLTVKANIADADPGVFQKAITTAGVSGQGQITDDGATDLVAGVTFELTAADTALLTAFKEYPYDVKVKSSGGKVYTFEEGVIRGTQRVTVTTT